MQIISIPQNSTKVYLIYLIYLKKLITDIESYILHSSRQKSYHKYCFRLNIETYTEVLYSYYRSSYLPIFFISNYPKN